MPNSEITTGTVQEIVVLKTMCPHDHFTSRYLFLLVMRFPLHFSLYFIYGIVRAETGKNLFCLRGLDPRKNKVGRRDADGKEELGSEPSTSHTPPNPFPEAPSIDFLRKRIKTVLKSCRNRYPADRLLRSTYSDLHLETASAEKRIKIAQVLEDMSKRSQDFRSNKREQPHTDLIIQICDWEQDHLRKRNSLV